MITKEDIEKAGEHLPMAREMYVRALCYDLLKERDAEERILKLKEIK